VPRGHAKKARASAAAATATSAHGHRLRGLAEYPPPESSSREISNTERERPLTCIRLSVAGAAAASIGAREPGDSKGLEIRSGGKFFQMKIAAVIILGAFVFLTSALVIALFIWAAIKDGQEDKALQRRLGIRRRTRIGR
jgi:hypothetical protein